MAAMWWLTDSERCCVAKRALAQCVESMAGARIKFLFQPRLHSFQMDKHGFVIYKEWDELHSTPLAPRGAAESASEFMRALQVLSELEAAGRIHLLRRRAWHELATEARLRIHNGRDEITLLQPFLARVDDALSSGDDGEWVLVGVDTEGCTDNPRHPGRGVVHLLQVAIGKDVLLSRAEEEGVLASLDHERAILAAFGWQDTAWLRARVPRATVVDVQAAAHDAGLVHTSRLALDRTFHKLCPDATSSFQKHARGSVEALQLHFEGANPLGAITWASDTPLTDERVSYAASDAWAHLQCLDALMDEQRARLRCSAAPIRSLPISSGPRSNRPLAVVIPSPTYSPEADTDE